MIYWELEHSGQILDGEQLLANAERMAVGETLDAQEIDTHTFSDKVTELASIMNVGAVPCLTRPFFLLL